MTVRGCGRGVARDVERDAVTAGALTVVCVRVCLAGALTVLTLVAGVPPPLDLLVTLDPRELVERDALELDLLERDPLDELERPLELELERPLELELERPLEREPPLELPAPADPVPERRANLAPPR
jgi:hypothetical protein